jgi:hypothetical protein
MRAELLRAGLRGLGLSAVVALGLAAIVGSGGGGALGFPPCTGPFCDSGPLPPPAATAMVEPPFLTVLVGASASFTAQVANFDGAVTYQWRRSNDGGNSYLDIAGATGPSYTLANANLADDRTVFQVAVRSSNGSPLLASGRLAVSRVPGLVFSDGEFLGANWLGAAVDGATPVTHSAERLSAGGNPGAYRRMVFQVPPGAGSARVFYSALSAVYQPQLQGAVYLIDYSEDCIALPGSEQTYSSSTLSLEQAGRRYLANIDHSCTLPSWNAGARRASLAAADFRLFDGPACGAGEACPNFGANAPPMRFGHWRIGFGTPGATVAHGIDNWKVTVWPR